MPFSNELLAAAGVTPESTQGTPPPYLNNDVEKKLNINQEPPKSLKELAQNRALKGLEKGMSLHTNNEQIKPYTYNAGSDSQSFYKRYHSFGQETFDKIGFSPFKNNDVAFNAQTSFLDRAQRSFVHGFLPLAGRGFVSGPKSLVRMLEGDFGDDPEDAAKYAEAAAIAQDTAGGVGSFFNNSLMNFGYTFGIIGEALAEEAAATIITAPMGGVGGFLNLPNLGAKVMRGARAIKGFETITDAAAGLNKAINSLTNINNTRKFFNADRIESALATRGGKVANFFNPAENLLETGLEIAKNTKQLQGWNKFQNATFKTAGALYRDVRNINMALSEARLEGGFTRNDTYKQLVDEYKAEHQGQAPPQNVKNAMMAKADEASKATMLANTLLIYASNKVTFNNVMNPKSGLAKMLSKKVAEVQKMAGQSTVREFTKQTLKSGKELLTPKLTTVKGAWATAKKQGVQKTVKAAIGYTKANLMEGAQEVLQEVIADTSKNYHLQSFYSQPVGHYMYTEAQRKAIEDKSFGDILGEAFSKQASWQGLETFASGFVMGAFASPLNRAIPFAQESYMRVFKKDEYKAHRDYIDKYVEKMTKSVNDTFAKNPLEFLNSKVFSLGTQAELANVIDVGDTKVERDAKEEATIKSVTDLIKMNSLDTWTDYMESLKELTTEEYAEAASISVEQAQGHVEKLDKVIGRAKEIEKTYNEYNKKFPNPIDLNDYNKGTKDYEKAEVYHNAWEEAKKNVVFYHENYKDTVTRMQKIYQSIGKEELLGKIDPNRVQALLKDDRLKGEIQILESEVQGLKGMTDSVSKRKLKQTETTLGVLKEYEKDYDNFMDHFFEKGMIEPGTEAEKAERLALDKEIESKLESSFKNYMKALAKQSDDIILDDSIDIAFNDVLDHYKLGREAGKLADAVNVLNDPAGFVDHVAKTYDWMYEMWNNREDYIQENISKQLDILKSNQLLNDMAGIGVYVDLDEFADYQETGVVPTEFFDAINKRVIKKGSPIYDKVAKRFMELSEFKKIIKESKPITKNKNEELAKLDAEEAQEISKLPKVPTRIVVKALDEKDFSTKLINDELSEGQYIDVIYKEEGVEKTATFFKDQDGILRQDNAQGEVADLESDIKYNNGEIYEIIDRPTDADIAEVKKKYDALRAELLERLTKYGPSASTEAMAKAVEEVKAMLLSDDEYTATRRNYIIKGKAYERMTNRIRENYSTYTYTNKGILEDAYDGTIGVNGLTEDSIKDFIKRLKSEEPAGFEDYTYTELEEELKSLMDEPLATALSADTQAKQADIERRRQEELESRKNKIEVSRTEYTDTEGNTYQVREFADGHAEYWMIYPNAPMPINISSDSSNIYTKEYLEKILDHPISEGKSVEPKRGLVDKINAKYDAELQAELNAAKAIDFIFSDQPTADAKTKEAEIPRSIQKELDALNEKIDKLNEQIDEADDAGNKARGENLRMRRQELYDLLLETSNRGKESVPEIKSDLKNYVINYAIENTYETAKANGIYLDNQFKAVFDPKSEGPKFDSKYITQEAYDNLFGENGYITSIKKRADAGEFYVFSTDLIVYTDKAKDPQGNPLPPVAGEIDFIFVDREGRKFIVDLKTGQVEKWLNYNTVNTKSYDKKIDNTLQQVGYANLSQMLSGDEFQIAIWPVELNYRNTGFINKAGRPSNTTLMLNQKPIGDLNSEPFIINLDKNTKFKLLNPEGDGTEVYMTAMDYMEQYVTGPVTPGTKKKAKPKAQSIPQDESSIVNSIVDEIETGNVIKAGMDANIAKTQGQISDASYKYLIGLINDKMNTNLMESAVLAAPGQEFITINDIFAEKFDGAVSVETKVNAGEVVTVESVDETNEEIILTSNNGDRFTVKFSEMNDYIVSPEQLEDLSKPSAPTYQPTQTEIDFANESISNVDDFLDSSELRNEATNEADNQTSDAIDNDLFSNLKC
jgi:hypothetical protein